MGESLKKQEKHLLEFYGQECPHCQRMKPVVEQVEKELGVEFSKLEVWHDDENKALLLSYRERIEDACGGTIGVPCFYNKKTGKALCGEIERGELAAFAKEE